MRILPRQAAVAAQGLRHWFSGDALFGLTATVLNVLFEHDAACAKKYPGAVVVVATRRGRRVLIITSLILDRFNG